MGWSLPSLSFSTSWPGLAHDLVPESNHICSVLLHHDPLTTAWEGGEVQNQITYLLPRLAPSRHLQLRLRP